MPTSDILHVVIYHQVVKNILTLKCRMLRKCLDMECYFKGVIVCYMFVKNAVYEWWFSHKVIISVHILTPPDICEYLHILKVQ